MEVTDRWFLLISIISAWTVVPGEKLIVCEIDVNMSIYINCENDTSRNNYINGGFRTFHVMTINGTLALMRGLQRTPKKSTKCISRNAKCRKFRDCSIILRLLNICT